VTAMTRQEIVSVLKKLYAEEISVLALRLGLPMKLVRGKLKAAERQGSVRMITLLGDNQKKLELWTTDLDTPDETVAQRFMARVQKEIAKRNASQSRTVRGGPGRAERGRPGNVG